MDDTLSKLKTRAAEVRVLVVGDVILDQFLYGTVDRISPEAPVPVVDVRTEVFRLGGAANVVSNLLALGAKVDLVGVVGGDQMGDLVRSLLAKSGCHAANLVTDHSRPTSVKTRVIAQHQQVVRYDREDKGPQGPELRHKVAAAVEAALLNADAVIVSDYGKGVVSENVMSSLISRAEATGIPVAVDPKPVNAILYRGAGVITPNARETEALCGVYPGTDEEAEHAGREMIKRFDARSILVTRGEKGMTLVERGGGITHIPTRAKDVFDVTGAGDTAISAFTLAWASGANLPGAAHLANLASGVVVGKLGTATATIEEIERALEEEG